MTRSAAQALCPACGPEEVPGAVLCSGCGSPLQPAERRVVTVLFADLVGYTRLCSSMDVEQVFLLVRPLMNALRKVCDDVGGAVPVIEGDGFMAVFGAKVGQEDDPQRAVFAATEMQRIVQERRAAYGDELGGLRIGLNVGEALVAPSWEPSGFSVSGDAVNVASRLCGLAPEGSVLVGSTLAALIGGDLWEEEVRAQVRNREEPVRYRALRWSAFEGRSLSRRALSSSPYVLRDVDAALRQVADADAGGAVHLLGEAGAGKSRALDELAAQVGPRALLVVVPSFIGPSLRAQLSEAVLEQAPQGLSLPELRALRNAAGRPVQSLERDDDAAVEAALVAGLARLVRPVLLVDDAHLCGSQDWALVERLLAARVDGATVVVVSRSDDARPLPVDVLHLRPLDDQGSRDLLEALLPKADERLLRMLVGRAGGNPLYLEQGAQMLLDDGTVQLTPDGCVVRRPARLRDLAVGMRLFVSSRLDLLDERDREVLSLAAVVGDPVDLDLLQHLDGRQGDLGDRLEVLVGRGLLRWVDGRTLRFKHQVVRDVAYQGLLRSSRVVFHRAASEWYSAVPVTGLLSAEAAHLEAAVALGEVDCELVRRAVVVLGSWALSILDTSMVSRCS